MNFKFSPCYELIIFIIIQINKYCYNNFYIDTASLECFILCRYNQVIHALKYSFVFELILK